MTAAASTGGVYRSKIDGWLIVVMAGASITALAACAPLLANGHVFVVLAMLLLAVALPWWVMAATTYTLAGDELWIRSGPFRWTVALADITSIRPTRSPLSSPALSLDRLRIDYGTHAIMVSPKQREAFLAELVARGVAVAANPLQR